MTVFVHAGEDPCKSTASSRRSRRRCRPTRISTCRASWFLDHLIDAGVHGVFVLGTNSEFYALDEREKQEVIATAVAHVNKRVPVYAGTGAETTREAVRLTKMAEREGADGVSVITPYFVQPSQQEIYDHYRRIAENTSLPVMLYNNPATCGGVKIEVDTVARLAQVPNILGIKDSSGDLQNTNRVHPRRCRSGSRC